ncbi:hypothetical protein BJ992_004029 [Sphaerisporangium rubeum]|uniref:Uncharacterized protein n=1 Tax=Sphaerisporangium rubeum TaxID=321317 RepID=A0A7X0IIF6_9ACTN|nr:hypothetical protein [Sphaerisporangium rubeum]
MSRVEPVVRSCRVVRTAGRLVHGEREEIR